MKSFKQFMFMLFSLAANAQADERSEWLAERRAWIEQAKSAKTPEAILNLARIVTGVGRNLEQASPEAKDLFYQAQSSLIAIPGHAEYYRDKIFGAQERLKNQEGDAPWSDYRAELMYGFQTLCMMPSPETVRVLGEMLSDDWVPPGNETAVLSEKTAPLAESSTVILTQFPIENKPFKLPLSEANLADARDAWQQWYEEIKSGKRTFRFEGDPTEYDLNGPAPGQKVERISRDLKRETDREAGRNKAGSSSVATSVLADTTPPKVAPIAAIIAGLVLLGSLVWYFVQIKAKE